MADESHSDQASPGQFFKCYSCGETFRESNPTQSCHCSQCNTTLSTVRAFLAFYEDNAVIQALATGPKSKADLPRIPSTGERARELIYTLKPPQRADGHAVTDHRDGWKQSRTVYYLEGDDREAMRVFIDLNYDFVTNCLTDDHNPFQTQWGDAHYTLLLEQWHFAGHATTAPISEADADTTDPDTSE